MGLDQYAFKVPKHVDNTDFSYIDTTESIQLAYWRKHPNLEGWVEQTFNRKADAQGFKGRTDLSMNIITTVTEVDGTSTSEELKEKLMSDSSTAKEMQASILKQSFSAMANNISKPRVYNCQPFRLNNSDLDQLEMHVRLGTLPPTTGFFFGDNSDEHYFKDDLQFIEAARKAIAEGFDVYYESSW